MTVAQMERPGSIRPRMSVSAMVAIATSILAVLLVLSAVPALLVQYYL